MSAAALPLDFWQKEAIVTFRPGDGKAGGRGPQVRFPKVERNQFFILTLQRKMAQAAGLKLFPMAKRP